MPKQVIRNFLQTVANFNDYLVTYRNEIKNIRRKKYLWRSIKLTEEQEKQIKSVFKNRVDNRWHKLYQAYSGSFDENYFPEILFSTKLVSILCPRNFCELLQDKSLQELLYGSVPNLRLAKTVILNCSGIYYDGFRNIINKEIAVAFLEQWNKSRKFIISPTDSNSGQKALIGNPEEYTDSEKILTLLEQYKKNYIVQELIETAEEVHAFYDKTVNTVRIMTYILDDRLFHTPLVFRMGREAKVSEDGFTGSIFVGVNEEGEFKKEAINQFGERFSFHPESKLRFEGYQLPGINKVIDCAYACHKKTPHIRFISWDFTLDQNRNPVLMEAKMLEHTAWLTQAAGGESIFGDNTKRMLEVIGMGEGLSGRA